MQHSGAGSPGTVPGAIGQGSVETTARRIGLRGAVSLNLMNMIGVGPFITLPLVVAALGPAAWLGWLLGALLAVCDGLVWAELGAALPRAGGSYAFLREIYKPSSEIAPASLAGTSPAASESTLPTAASAIAEKKHGFHAGRFVSFLYVWQLLFTAPLSVASGALGLSQYAAFLWPALRHPLQLKLGVVTLAIPATSVLAAGVCALVVALLYRGLGSVLRTAGVLTAGVLITLCTVIAVGLTHLQGSLVAAQMHWPQATPGSSGLLEALGAATLITTYDYWGYYNVCFLGEQVREPGRTIPRAVLVSIALVALLYLGMNFAVLGALPLQGVPQHAQHTTTLQPMAALLMRTVLPPHIATFAAPAIAILIMWTAFSSVVALLLGYSRAPYAAARDGNFFAPFARVHRRHGFPNVALLALGVLAMVFCFFDLRTVISALVAVRIVLQYGMQQAGVMVLRFRQPLLVRPFRMWLYPLPPLLALAGFGFLLFARKGAGRELLFAVLLGASGALLYTWREWRATRQRSRVRN
jgi:amino acid transporter